MKTKVEELQDNQVKLTVSVDAKEIDDRIKKTYKDFSYKYNFPGFRRGKAPRQIIDNALGAEAVRATVTDDVIKECTPLAVDESGFFPISQVRQESEDSMVEGGKEYSFSFTFTKKPGLTLSNYDPVEIELPGDTATDEDIDAQIEMLRDHYFTFEDGTAASKVAEGGAVDLAMKGTDDKGENIDFLDSDSRLYVLGSGIFPVEFDNELIGMKKGQKKSFDIEFKGLYPTGLAALAGQSDSVHFDIEVKAVKKKVLPEITDEWARDTCGFESIEDMKSRIGETVTQSKKDSLPRYKETKALEALAERLEGEVPEPMINAAQADLLQKFFQQLQSSGMSFDGYLHQMGISADEFQADVEKQAQDVSKQDLALDAWAIHKKMTVTEKDLDEEFAKSGAEDPKALLAEWRENGQLHMIRQGILRMRAADEVIESAIVSEAKPEKKSAAKKAPAKKAPAKKAAAKSDDKKPAEKKPAAKKAPAKKPAVAKKTAAKKDEE
ncbi:MAG: trigger factor [Raoultibacter sp.]